MYNSANRRLTEKEEAEERTASPTGARGKPRFIGVIPLYIRRKYLYQKKGCATFAYFSVTVSQDSNTTTVTAKADSVGLVTVSGSSKEYELSVTANDMTKPEIDKKYYAMESSGGDSSSTSGGKWKDTENELDVGSIALTGGSTGEKIDCNVTVQLTASGEMAKELKSGDVKFSLTGDDIASVSGLDAVEDIDLNSIDLTGDSRTKSYTGTMTLNGTSDTKNIKAKVYLTNKKSDGVSETEAEDAGNQSYLAGKNMTITFTLTASCSVKGE